MSAPKPSIAKPKAKRPPKADPIVPRVEVTWRDAMSLNGWMELGDVLESKDLATCCSLGYVIHETDDVLFLAQSLGAAGPVVGDVLAIPKGMILRKVTVAYGR